MRRLRVIDFGSVSALRSQTLWHAIARGVSDGSPPTLSFMSPTSPYVSIGLHRRLDEIDGARCRAWGLPVFRREVGGGPVYLDDGQLFFQITLPASQAPPVRATAVRTLLEPAVVAFREAGVEARLDNTAEIVVDDRKVCGHGAGQIGQAVIVVGNLILSFDHRSAAGILTSPSEDAASEAERLMRRYVAPTPADPDTFRRAAVRAYGAALALEPEPGELQGAELAHLAELDRRFVDPEWLEDQPHRPRRDGWVVKIKGDVWVGSWGEGSTRLTLSMAGDSILRARIEHARLNGEVEGLEHELQGMSLDGAGRRLARLGVMGRGLAELLERAPQVAPR